MEAENDTSVEDFLIVGFSDLPQLRLPLFLALLLIYLITMVGNLLIMVIIYSNFHLHTPMYFFLTNLSFLDITSATIIFPKTLAHFFMEGTHVSLSECLLQTYFFGVMMATEFCILSVMAYDRYVAICHPLRYVIIVNKAVCIQLAAGSWTISFMFALPHTILISGLSFCKSREINHFFCDLTALLKLSCSNIHTIETLTYIFGPIITVVPFLLIVASYINIVSAVLKIQSTEGRRKAFSTCASHLTVVILYCGSICFMYIRPTSTFAMKDNKILSLSYIAVTPMCNPIIYSLKNTEFKNALRRAKSEI